MSRLLRCWPHLLAGALCTGMACANAVPAEGAWVAASAVGVASASVLAPRSARVVLFGAALALAGLWWGSVRLDALARSSLVAEAGTAGRTTAVVTGPARTGRFGLRVPAQVRRFRSLVVRERVLLELPLGRAPPQGGVLDLLAEIRLPHGPRNGFDERAWLGRQGIHVVLRGDRWRLVGRRGGVWGLADRLRSRLLRSTGLGLEGERRAVLEGVVLGEDGGLSEELRQRFRASGLFHLLAVSGQNVALVAGAALLLGWLLGMERWLAELGALAGIAGYVLAVGAQPSVVRAGVAGSLGSLAWLAARERDRWYFLLLGAFVLLAWNPATVRDPGFQLSFAAVASIFTLVPRLRRRLEGYPLPPGLGAVVAVSAACGAVTAPIVWLQFHAIPVLTVPANAIAAPAMVPLLGLALAGAMLAPVSPGAAAMLAWLNGWCAAYLAACARLVGGLSFAQVTSTSGLALLVGGLLGVVLLVRLPRGPRVVLAGLAALVLLVALALSWSPRPAAPPFVSGLRITFLDVGQGDAELLQVPEGAVLVDQGPPEANVVRQLRRLGVRRLAALVVTHVHRDHVGGASSVLARVPVDFLLDPLEPTANPFERAALAEARRRRVPIVAARAGSEYRLGRLRIRVLWPDGGGLRGEDPHDHAVVLLVSYGEIDALLTADAESPITLPLHPPPVEILKVAHHGSADSGLPSLLGELRPRVAVISVGARNDYGHPRRSTLAALEQVPGLALYRTDLDGWVTLDTDGRSLSVRSAR